MDDRKLIAATRNRLEQMLKIVKEFLGNIGTLFGLDKRRIYNPIKGKIEMGAFEVQNGQNITTMEAEQTYKYLGMKQSQIIDQRTMEIELTNNTGDASTANQS